MSETHIAFIGGGNMATSLVGGLVAEGFSPDHIVVTDPDEEQRTSVQRRTGVRTLAANAAAVAEADVVVLAVKPQILRAVCESIREEVQGRRPLIVSIAAGVRSGDVERWLGDDLAVVRTMPNTPALVGAGATGLFANARVSDAQRQAAESIMRSVGITVWVNNEADIDAITALSGSGPAYCFLVMEAMQGAGERLGLSADLARLLTLQTAFGAAKMALESDDAPARLREKVTSPGGTTEQALKTLMEGGLPKLFDAALLAARERAGELAERLGDDD